MIDGALFRIQFEEVCVGIKLKSGDRVRLVVLELKGVEQSSQLGFREADSSLEETVPKIANVNLFLFVILQNIVHESILSSAQSCHHVDRNNGGKLERKVAL